MSAEAREWVAQFPNRDAVAVAYADLLREHGDAWPWWSELNSAIAARWSESALRYIKERAWKRAGELAKAAA